MTVISCENSNMHFYMYILKCSDGSLYTGSTNNLEMRLEEHRRGEGSNFTKRHLPVELLYTEEFSSIEKAFEREKQIQGWSRKKKEALVKGHFDELSDLSQNTKRNRINEIFTRLRSQNPNPASELNYVNAYTLLVAVVLSAQATDKSVNIATEPLFKVVTTPEQMVALGEEKLITYIKSIGLYKTKAKHVIELSEKLISDFNSQVPQSREELMSLPGVGQKTANVVQNVIFKMPTMPVDTHIFRVSHRIGLSEGDTPNKVEEDLLKITPEEFAFNAHHWLLLHGRYVCTAKNPKCEACLISDLCAHNL